MLRFNFMNLFHKLLEPKVNLRWSKKGCCQIFVAQSTEVKSLNNVSVSAYNRIDVTYQYLTCKFHYQGLLFENTWKITIVSTYSLVLVWYENTVAMSKFFWLVILYSVAQMPDILFTETVKHTNKWTCSKRCMVKSEKILCWLYDCNNPVKILQDTL